MLYKLLSLSTLLASVTFGKKERSAIVHEFFVYGGLDPESPLVQSDLVAICEELDVDLDVVDDAGWEAADFEEYNAVLFPDNGLCGTDSSVFDYFIGNRDNWGVAITDRSRAVISGIDDQFPHVEYSVAAGRDVNEDAEDNGYLFLKNIVNYVTRGKDVGLFFSTGCAYSQTVEPTYLEIIHPLCRVAVEGTSPAYTDEYGVAQCGSGDSSSDDWLDCCIRYDNGWIEPEYANHPIFEGLDSASFTNWKCAFHSFFPSGFYDDFFAVAASAERYDTDDYWFKVPAVLIRKLNH